MSEAAAPPATEIKQNTEKPVSQDAVAATPAAGKEESAEDSDSAPVTLYVGDLTTSVTEAILYEIFSNIGPVTSIRVCRDAVTYESLGYAYVNFSNHADAKRAMAELNYAQIKGRQCRIMWSMRDPNIRKNGKGNVFIKNLDPSIDNKTLHDTFSEFGEILSCKVVTGRKGQSFGYGYIHFATGEAAQEAIEMVNGMVLNGQAVFVSQHIPRQERESHTEAIRAQFTNVYVNNLPATMTEEAFRELFEKFGTIKALKLTNPEDTATQKAFGLIDFENHEAAQKAVDELNDKEIEGTKIYVGRAQSRFERKTELRKKFEKQRTELLTKYQGTNLYVKNLEDSVDDEKLKELFAPFGTIVSAKVMTDDQKTSRGFGFVSFSTPDEANKAISEMNSNIVGSKPLYVALAQRKDVRQNQMKQRFNAQKQFNMKQNAVAGALPPHMVGGPMMYPPQGFVNGPAPGVRVPYPAGPQVVVPPRGVPPMGQWQQPPKGGVPAPVPTESLLKSIENLPEDQKKQAIGEILYPKIIVHVNGDAQLAGKITGMLLDWEDSELLALVEDDASLKDHVKDAQAVYEDFLKRNGN